MDITMGRRRFLGYLKTLGGSNIVKVIPAPTEGSASGSQTTGEKRLKVICGNYTFFVTDGEWTVKTTKSGETPIPMTFCEVRVSPSNSVKPNIGASELADTLNRVLPFTAKDDARPILQCVNFIAKEGKLTLVSADGFRLAINRLDFDGEGQALVNADDLKGVVSALRKAKRARIGFEPSGESLDGMSLVIDTELIRYKLVGVNGEFPAYEKLIPTEFNTVASFDTIEAIKAVNSLNYLSSGNSYPTDLTIGDGKVVMANPDEDAKSWLNADTNGEVVKVRIDGSYLAQALKACGGIVELKLTNGYSPMLFSSNGYQLVIMPMLSVEASEQAKKDREAKQAEAEPVPVAVAEPVAEKPKKGKGKGKGKTEPEPATEPVAEAEPEPATEPEPEPVKV